MSRPRRPLAESHQSEKSSRRQVSIARVIILNTSYQLGEKTYFFRNDDVQVCKMSVMPRALRQETVELIVKHMRHMI
jgi:hypothetical protein